MGENKVVAGYFINAYGTDGQNAISEEAGPAEIEKILKDSIGLYLGFIVFYEGRSVMISNRVGGCSLFEQPSSWKLRFLHHRAYRSAHGGLMGCV
jgi:hypothetical protein